MFVGYLSLEGRAPSSVNSHISALAFVHKINNWPDPTDNFVVTKLKEGCRRSGAREDARLPITPVILSRVINSLTSICRSTFEFLLFRAAFLMAFFGFLRVGEYAAASKHADCSRILALDDIKVVDSNSVQVRVRYSKTDQRGISSVIKLDSSTNVSLCPVNALVQYLAVRSPQQGPLFIHFNKEPLTYFQVNYMLKKAIRTIGLTPGNFSSHSFRIGAATAASMGGLSDEKIKELGRWKSTAFQLYIRPQMLSI